MSTNTVCVCSSDAEEARIAAQRLQEDEERRAKRLAAKKSNVRPLVPSTSARGPSRTPATFRKEQVCSLQIDQLNIHSH